MEDIIIKELVKDKGKRCEKILRVLPEWFGIESAIIEYVKVIEEIPTLGVFRGNGRLIGFVSIKTHNRWCAEIYVMGILKEFHGYGIGGKLISEAEKLLIKNNIEYLEVKTLGSSHPDVNYMKTRNFYIKNGFRPMEEFKKIWGDDNPCLIMIKKI